MQINLIIPTLNEAENLEALLPYLRSEVAPGDKIIVTDGGSTDAGRTVTEAAGCTFFPSPDPGRGPQMNAAVAAHPEADVYYFVHADTLPPRGFRRDIIENVEKGFPVGCYRFCFKSPNPLLKINAFFTRFPPLACRGGDQSLYVSRTAFEELGGFAPDMRIMEDYDIIERARERFPFRIMPRRIKVSARKYRANNYFRVQLANLRVFRMYRRGAGQEEMIATYRRLLKPW